MTLMNSHREESLLKLESFFTDLIQSIELGQEPDIHLASWGNRGRGSNRRVRFLSPKYLRMVWTMASMYENILEDKSVNQRQLYYSNKRASVDDKLSQPDAFNSSAQAASTVLECCALLGLSRCDLQVASTARGLVAGHLFIGNLSGQPSTEWRSLADLDAPTRIEPTFLTARSRASSASDWLQVPTHAGRPIPVVLFEKDAIFQDFYRSGIWRRDYPCVMVTGCGVPDIPTRALVSALDALGCPIVAFVDYNPSGLLILSTYAVGSSTTGARHVAGRVGAGESSLLEVPRILLGGVTAADILFVDRHHCQPFGARDESVLRTLQRRCLDGTLIGMAALGDMRREVDAMAAAPRKVELGTEGTCRGPDGRPTPLSAWVATRCAALVADHPLSPPHHGRDPHYAPHAPHRLAPSARSDTQFASKVPHGRGRGLDGKEATLGGHPAAYVHAGSHPAPAGLPPATADAGLYADYHAQVASADVDEYDIDAFL